MQKPETSGRENLFSWHCMCVPWGSHTHTAVAVSVEDWADPSVWEGCTMSDDAKMEIRKQYQKRPESPVGTQRHLHWYNLNKNQHDLTHLQHSMVDFSLIFWQFHSYSHYFLYGATVITVYCKGSSVRWVSSCAPRVGVRISSSWIITSPAALPIINTKPALLHVCFVYSDLFPGFTAINLWLWVYSSSHKSWFFKHQILAFLELCGRQDAGFGTHRLKFCSWHQAFRICLIYVKDFYKRLVHLAFLKKFVFSKPQIMAFLEFDFLAYSARKSNVLLLHSFSQAVLLHPLRPTIHLKCHI